MKKTETSTKGIVLPILVTMPILTILFSLAGSKLILSEILPENAMKWMPWVITGVVSVVLSLFAALKMKQKKFLWGFGTACVYLSMLLISNLLFFGEEYQGILPIASVVLGCGILGSLIGAGKRRKFA